MMTKKILFKNATLQKEFDENGFVKITLLTTAEADDLFQFYQTKDELHAINNSLHHTTTDTQNNELIFAVDNKIKSVFKQQLDKHLNHYKALASCFHIKEVGNGSATGVHQDPTFVNEGNFYSANVWVALHDVDSANGNLSLVKGSHRVVQSLRPIPNYSPYYQNFYDTIREQLVEVPLKKGEAIIFQNATIHGATDNTSTTKRVAATLLIASDEAQWCVYYKEPNKATDMLEKYDLDWNAFVAMSSAGKPSAACFKERIPYSFPVLTQEEFTQKVHTTERSKSILVNWIQSLLKWEK